VASVGTSGQGSRGLIGAPPSIVRGGVVKRGLNRFEFKWIQTNFNSLQTLTNQKNDVTLLGKIEIKYGFEGFEELNNFLDRNFFRFNLGFE
jgi:hypothetical protein